MNVAESGAGGGKAKGAWSFLVYLAGDNNLSDAADTDLAEMRAVGSTGDVNIVAEIDNAGEQGTRRFRVEKDGKGEQVETLSETDSGDPETLYRFVQWASAHYPAERYCLVIWNHGSGWEPSEMDRIARNVGATSYTGRETVVRTGSQLRRALFRPTIESVYKLPTIEQRAIASDDGTGHSLDTVELGKVIKRIRDLLGQPLDVLGLDACLMSSLEVAWELRDDVRYMVGSLDNEPNNGWPYDAILGWLSGGPKGWDAEHLALAIPKLYAASYQGHPRNVTQSAFDLSKIGDMRLPLECLAKELTDEIQYIRGIMYKAQTRSAHFWGRTLWDLGHWCDELRKLNPGIAIEHATKCVVDKLGDRTGFVIANEHQGQRVHNVSGVSIYLPTELTPISPYYDDLRFAKDTRWQSVLYAYHNGARAMNGGTADVAVPRSEGRLRAAWVMAREERRRLELEDGSATRRLVDTEQTYDV